MKKLLIIILSVMLLFSNSCKKDPAKGAINSTHMDISYQDKSGNDLLDSKTPGYYAASNIHVYKIVNGVKTDVNNPMMASPRDFFIYKEKDDTISHLRIFLDNPTYLQLNQNTIDTITCDIEKSNGNILLKKFWYNGKLYWDNLANPQVINVIK